LALGSFNRSAVIIKGASTFDRLRAGYFSRLGTVPFDKLRASSFGKLSTDSLDKRRASRFDRLRAGSTADLYSRVSR
jgi:hypothetical protein